MTTAEDNKLPSQTFGLRLEPGTSGLELQHGQLLGWTVLKCFIRNC